MEVSASVASPEAFLLGFQAVRSGVSLHDLSSQHMDP